MNGDATAEGNVGLGVLCRATGWGAAVQRSLAERVCAAAHVIYARNGATWLYSSGSAKFLMALLMLQRT